MKKLLMIEDEKLQAAYNSLGRLTDQQTSVFEVASIAREGLTALNSASSPGDLLAEFKVASIKDCYSVLNDLIDREDRKQKATVLILGEK